MASEIHGPRLTRDHVVQINAALAKLGIRAGGVFGEVALVIEQNRIVRINVTTSTQYRDPRDRSPDALERAS